MIYLFFFSSYSHHRTLHSFPTRRSSDLMPSFRLLTRPACDAAKRLRSPNDVRRKISPKLRRSVVAPLAARSEEHTSELQSLRHLVCRLLLEKKKKQKKIHKNSQIFSHNI